MKLKCLVTLVVISTVALMSTACGSKPKSYIEGNVNLDSFKLETKSSKLEKTTPEEQNMDSKTLKLMDSTIKESFPRLRSMIVLRHGKVVFEAYYGNKNSKDNLKDIMSSTKTITAILIGTLVDKGLIKGLDQKIYDFFPEYIDSTTDKRFKDMTLEDVLSMKAGLDWNEIGAPWDNDEFLALDSGDPVKYFFSKKIISNPGDKFAYNSQCSYLLSAIIKKVTGKKASEYAEDVLFKPLGIKEYAWEEKGGNSIGGHGLMLKPIDIAKLGQFFLSKGKVGKREIVSSEWINQMITTRSTGGAPENISYGLQTWLGREYGENYYLAAGMGGQYIYCNPTFDLVVITTSKVHPINGYKSLISTFVIPSLKDRVEFSFPEYE